MRHRYDLGRAPVGGARVAIRRYVPELALTLSVELRYFASGMRMTLAEHSTGFSIIPSPRSAQALNPSHLSS